jgi:hypothetical protein
MSAEHRPDFPCGVRTRLREWPASTRPAPLAGAQGKGATVPFPSASDAAEARFRRDLLAGIRDVAGSGLVTDPHDLAPLPEGSDAGEGECDWCGRTDGTHEPGASCDVYGGVVALRQRIAEMEDALRDMTDTASGVLEVCIMYSADPNFRALRAAKDRARALLD